jgi:phosphatidylcholine synthase
VETTSGWQRAGAAAVHLYTASGAVLALLIVLAAVQGNVTRALWLGLVALIIDGTDGMLARRMRVKEHIPWFDGARLDDIVDYLTYVFAPVLLLWTSGFLPSSSWGIAIATVPLVASTYQFCRVDAKTDERAFFFLGFPSYWNVVAFYVIVMGLSPAVVGTILLTCSVLVFVPVRYVYPSRTVAFRPLTLALTAVWLVAYAAILAQLPDPNAFWLTLSILYLVYYVGLSLHLTAQRRRSGTGMLTPSPAGMFE